MQPMRRLKDKRTITHCVMNHTVSGNKRWGGKWPWHWSHLTDLSRSDPNWESQLNYTSECSLSEGEHSQIGKLFIFLHQVQFARALAKSFCSTKALIIFPPHVLTTRWEEMTQFSVHMYAQENGGWGLVLVLAHFSGSYRLHANSCQDTERPGVI